MRTRFTALAGVAVLATGFGFAPAVAASAERPASAEQRGAVSAPQKAAAISMAVYKSPT